MIDDSREIERFKGSVFEDDVRGEIRDRRIAEGGGLNPISRFSNRLFGRDKQSSDEGQSAPIAPSPFLSRSPNNGFQGQQSMDINARTEINVNGVSSPERVAAILQKESERSNLSLIRNARGSIN
jgi:hypothetical protein